MLFATEKAFPQVDSAQFDGVNDYITRGASLNGAADSKSGILSLWIRFDVVSGRIFCSATTLGGSVVRFILEVAGNSTLSLGAANSAGTNILQVNTVSTFSAGATWRHVLASWDLAAAATHLYINDVSDKNTTTATNDTIDYTVADWAIGAAASGLLKMDGCLAEVYFAPGQFLDFSVEANRRKFISALGKPVYLGTDGSLPTGTTPLVYQRLADMEAIANFATNRGTGGDFTISGALTTGSTSPSD
jgi:hypothetical protein